VKAVTLTDAPVIFREHIADKIRDRAWRGSQRALRATLRRAAVERELAERGPHAAPVGSAVRPPPERRGGHRRRRVETSRRRVLAPLRVVVAAERILERVEISDGNRGDGDRHPGPGGERGGEVGARLSHRRGKG